MFELNGDISQIHPNALDAALRLALGKQMIGLSTYGPDRPISIWLVDDTTQDAARAVVTAHDPVFLSADKASIRADGLDEATITVRAPKPDAVAVILVADGIEIPVDLVDGIGEVGIVSLDEGLMVWTVKNPANRTADAIRIEVSNG